MVFPDVQFLLSSILTRQYFELTGRTLLKSSDQFVEAAHHKVKAFFDTRSNYNHKEKVSVESGEATLAGIVHFNSINI